MTVRRTIIVLCMAVTAAWLAAALWRFTEAIAPITGFRDVWVHVKELTETVPIAYGVLLLVLSGIFLREAGTWSAMRRGTWLGDIAVGTLPFLSSAFLLIQYVARHGGSVLSDGVFWWGTWFLPVFFTALPAVLVGAGLGAAWARWRG